MIANCINLLIKPTFLLFICTILEVLYSRRASQIFPQKPITATWMWMAVREDQSHVLRNARDTIISHAMLTSLSVMQCFHVFQSRNDKVISHECFWQGFQSRNLFWIYIQLWDYPRKSSSIAVLMKCMVNILVRGMELQPHTWVWQQRK